MVPNVTAILQRFTTEWTALLQPEAILAACREVGHTDVARPRAHARHHHPVIPATDSARQHGL